MSTPTPPQFGERLRAAAADHGPLCVGIDPHAALLTDWGLEDSVEGLRRFTGTVVEAVAGRVALVKPQSAFFERHGSGGIAVLEEALATLRAAGTLTLLDAKRGDIGSTMDAYADAYLAADAPLAADAVTLSPYLGYASLRGAIDLARANGRGVFVLALTSNPEAASVQRVGSPGHTVADGVVTAAAADNAAAPAGTWGDVGLVIGATVGSAVRDLRLDLAGVRGPLLAPGFGAQGADAADLAAVFGPALARVVPNASRQVLREGPSVGRMREAIAKMSHDLSAVGVGRSPGDR